jgi:hypothetical protein
MANVWNGPAVVPSRDTPSCSRRKMFFGGKIIVAHCRPDPVLADTPRVLSGKRVLGTRIMA